MLVSQGWGKSYTSRRPVIQRTESQTAVTPTCSPATNLVGDIVLIIIVIYLLNTFYMQGSIISASLLFSYLNLTTQAEGTVSSPF